MGELQSIHHSAIIHQLLSHSLFFSLALFIYQTLQFKREAVDPEQHLACTDSNLLTWTHDEKTSKQQKNFIPKHHVTQQLRDVAIFHAEGTVAARVCVFVCVFICVCRADWTQIRGGVTGHSLIEQQPECDCCPSLSLSASLLTTYAFFFAFFLSFFLFLYRISVCESRTAERRTELIDCLN